MKKILALILAVILCAALAACGGNGGSEQAAATEAPTEKNSLAAFLDTAEGYMMAQGFKESAESGGNCTAECYADGNALVFDAKFTQEIPADKFDYFKDYLDEYLADPDFVANFDDARETLDKYMDASAVTFKIIYRDINGDILVEKDY